MFLIEKIKKIFGPKYVWFVWSMVLLSSSISSLIVWNYTPYLKHADLLLVFSMVFFLYFLFSVGMSWLDMFVYYRLGRFIGGIGEFREIQISYGLSTIPTIFGLILCLTAEFPAWQKICDGATDGKILYTEHLKQTNGYLVLTAMFIIFGALGIQSFFLSAVHKLSIWKSVVIVFGFTILTLAIYHSFLPAY